MKVEVQVLKDDIRRGRKSDVDDCAFARRLKKMGFKKVRVTHSKLRLGVKRLVTVPMPWALARWISLFDLNKSIVRPMKVVLNVPRAAMPKALLETA